MKYLFLILVLSLFNADLCQAQHEYTGIPFLKISDSTLISNINKLISREVNSDTAQHNPYAKGFGYVILNVREHSKGDTLKEYYISPMWLSYKEGTLDIAYPDAYSYVGGQLVIISISAFNKFISKQYSTKTKKRFRKLINARLEKTKRAVFYDMNGKKSFTDKKFRLDYFKFHGGIYTYMMKNKPPIIVEE